MSSMNDVARLKDIDNLTDQTAQAINYLAQNGGSSSVVVNVQAFYATLVAGEIASSTAGGDSTVDESQLPEVPISASQRGQTFTFTQIIDAIQNQGITKSIGYNTSPSASGLVAEVVSLPSHPLPYLMQENDYSGTSFMEFEVAMPILSASDYGDWSDAAGDYVFRISDTQGIYKAIEVKITITAE